MALLASDEKNQQVTQQTTQQATTDQQQTTQQAQQQVSQPAEAAPVAAPKQQASGYNKAMTTLKAAQNTAPSFSSDYDQTIADLYTQITSREPFKYDYSADPLYGQYREQYTQQGKQAMKDTMGQAAALTGGYGSSYGQAVGQQQYDAYLQRLNEVLPDLYKTAYDQYNAEGDKLVQQMQLAGTMRDTEYGQFRDAVSDKQYQDAFAIQQAESRAQYGDFGGYEDIYGKDAANKMRLSWAAANPDAAYTAGTIDANEYYQLTGKRPRGLPGAGGNGTPQAAMADIMRSQAWTARNAAEAKGNWAGNTAAQEQFNSIMSTASRL